MNINSQISHFFRSIGLIYFADLVRYKFKQISMRSENQSFKRKHPHFKLPPDYLLYESFQLNYTLYYETGRETAEWLANHFKKYVELKDVKILDWGCGPGRVIRHLPDFAGANCKIYGTDYNERSIEWCKANLELINFNLNTLDAKLPYPNNFFDVIYGLSIFTHLSEKMHADWVGELMRLLKPNGILFITTQGDIYRSKLIESERKIYDAGQIVVRGKVKEGHRTFSAFHPEKFMRKLFDNYEIATHIQPEASEQNPFPQDIWIIRKPNNPRSV